MNASPIKLRAEVSDEPNRLVCPRCQHHGFRIFTEGERAEAGAVLNCIECDGCHLMLSVRVSVDDPVEVKAVDLAQVAGELANYAMNLSTWTCAREEIGNVRPLKDLLWEANAVCLEAQILLRKLNRHGIPHRRLEGKYEQ